MYVRLMNGVTVELPDEMAEGLIEAGKAKRAWTEMEVRSDAPPTSNGGATPPGPQPATERKRRRLSRGSSGGDTK